MTDITLPDGRTAQVVDPQQQNTPAAGQPSDIETYIVFLEALRQMKQPLTTAPTFTPKNLLEQIQFYDDGSTKSLYLYINKVWQQFSGASTAGFDNGNITGTATIDWSKGKNQYATMTGNVTLTFTNPVADTHYTLHLAGAYTPTFPSTVRWTGGTTPTATATSGHKDLYTFIYSGLESLYDGLQSPNYSIT